MRAKALVVAAAVVGLLGAAGCSGGAEPAEPDAPSTASAPVSDPAPVARGAWTYEVTPTPDGEERSATVTGPQGRLTFATDPVYGKAARLEPASGDVECPTGCRAEVALDARPLPPWQVSRPESPRPTISFREPERLWEQVSAGRMLTITYPSAAGATTTATFDVTAVDPAALPDF